MSSFLLMSNHDILLMVINMSKVEVVPYNPVWKIEFEKAAQAYSKLLRGLEVNIEHVGSTSIEGLWAKPILDIDIIVPNSKVSQLVIERLESVQYKHVGNQGVKNREVLKYSKDNAFVTWMNHHLYVCIDNTENINNHLLLRQHLRQNREAVEAYSHLKRELASRFPNDIDAYIEGKTPLITSFLEKEGMSQTSIERIRSINKKEETKNN